MIIFCREKKKGQFSRPKLETQLSKQLHTELINFPANELAARTQEGTVRSVKQAR